MPRLGSTSFAFPEFSGATRRLILWNLAAYFGLALAGMANRPLLEWLAAHLMFDPQALLSGSLWQPLTYSLVHPALGGTLFELLSLWFLAGFLESSRTSSWVTGLYAASVLGTAAAALALYSVGAALGHAPSAAPLYGCFGGIFGLLVAIGVLFGETRFLMFFVISIKARHLAVVYGLLAVAMLFSQQGPYAFAQLGGAAAGLLYVRMASSRGFGFAFSESWYGLRNRYYRWKRRRASRKFEVYMRSQGRTVRFDGQGRPLDDDPSDKKRWN